MAVKNNNSAKKSTTNWKIFINFCAYVAIALIGVVLVLNKLVGTTDFANALSVIANTIAYVIVAISGFYFAKSKRNFWYIVVWVVAVVLIVVSYII